MCTLFTPQHLKNKGVAADDREPPLLMFGEGSIYNNMTDWAPFCFRRVKKKRSVLKTDARGVFCAVRAVTAGNHVVPEGERQRPPGSDTDA